MLFKTLRASVYGIDAHLVLVEVDVGVGRMKDSNVVGLPDNAVKESVKSQMHRLFYHFRWRAPKRSVRLATLRRAAAQRDKEIQFFPIKVGELLKLYEVNASFSQFTLRNKRVGFPQTSCHLHLS